MLRPKAPSLTGFLSHPIPNSYWQILLALPYNILIHRTWLFLTPLLISGLSPSSFIWITARTSRQLSASPFLPSVSSQHENQSILLKCKSHHVIPWLKILLLTAFFSLRERSRTLSNPPSGPAWSAALATLGSYLSLLSASSLCSSREGSRVPASGQLSPTNHRAPSLGLPQTPQRGLP